MSTIFILSKRLYFVLSMTNNIYFFIYILWINLILVKNFTFNHKILCITKKHKHLQWTYMHFPWSALWYLMESIQFIVGAINGQLVYCSLILLIISLKFVWESLQQFMCSYGNPLQWLAVIIKCIRKSKRINFQFRKK